MTKTIVQYEPTRTVDDRYQDLDYEKDELISQAQEIEESMKDPEVYGPDSVFLSLKDKCFAISDGEYLRRLLNVLLSNFILSAYLCRYDYNLCWFKEAKQEMKHGSSKLIGKWHGWGENSIRADGSNSEKNYKLMIYNDGDMCGSKAREAKVHLECGWKNQIISIDEPSMCRYLFKFSTPLACIL